jgi:uncharacterized lipoprotein
MKKKFLAIVLGVFALLVIAACGPVPTAEIATNESAQSNQPAEPEYTGLYPESDVNLIANTNRVQFLNVFANW